VNTFVRLVRGAGTFARGRRNALMRRYITMRWYMSVLQKKPLPVGHLCPHLIPDFLDPHESEPKRHLDRLSRFCTAHRLIRMPNKQTQTDTQTTLRAISIAIGRIYVLRAGIAA